MIINDNWSVVFPTSHWNWSLLGPAFEASFYARAKKLGSQVCHREFAMGWVLDEAGSRDMASISLREDVRSSEKKADKAKLFCPPLPVFQFSICPKVFWIFCWMLFQWVLFFPDPGTCLLGLTDLQQQIFLFGFKSHVSKRTQMAGCADAAQAMEYHKHVLKGSIVSLSSASQSFVVPLRFRHEPVDAMPAPRRILQHPVLFACGRMKLKQRCMKTMLACYTWIRFVFSHKRSSTRWSGGLS